MAGTSSGFRTTRRRRWLDVVLEVAVAVVPPDDVGPVVVLAPGPPTVVALPRDDAWDISKGWLPSAPVERDDALRPLPRVAVVWDGDSRLVGTDHWAQSGASHCHT